MSELGPLLSPMTCCCPLGQHWLFLDLISVKEELGAGLRPAGVVAGCALWGAQVLLLLGVCTAWICSSLGQHDVEQGCLVWSWLCLGT